MLLEGMQKGLVQDLTGSLNKLIKWLNAGKMTPDDLPVSLKDLYIGKDGRYQIKVIPKEDVWDFDKLNRFVTELRKVDPEVSGVPVGVLESARLMHRTFLSAAALTIALVTIILWLYSRSFLYILLTMLPLGVSILWLLEIMGWFNLHFNLANFFAIPILIAIGVDGGVHLFARSARTSQSLESSFWGKTRRSLQHQHPDRRGTELRHNHDWIRRTALRPSSRHGGAGRGHGHRVLYRYAGIYSGIASYPETH